MPVLKSVQEFFYCAVVKGVNSYDLVVGEDDTDRDGDIISITFVERIVFGWRFDYDQLHIVFFFKAASFIDIQ